MEPSQKQSICSQPSIKNLGIWGEKAFWSWIIGIWGPNTGLPPHTVSFYFPHADYAAAVKSLQSCPTLCNPIDSSPLGSVVPGILQARTLEWVAISFSNAWKWKVKMKLLSHVQLFTTPWTAAYQAPPSMGFSRQEYWSGVPLLSLKTLTVGNCKIRTVLSAKGWMETNLGYCYLYLMLRVYPTAAVSITLPRSGSKNSLWGTE